MTEGKIRLAWIALASAALICGALYAIRVCMIAVLYQESLSPTVPYSPTIDRLATFRGKRATAALLAIAKSQRASADNQDAAIRALARHGDSQTALELAKMLNLNDGLSMREAISETLQKLPCDYECIGYVLRYLERRWYGEKGSEENIGEMNEFVRKIARSNAT
jgi:hypothetical protein